MAENLNVTPGTGSVIGMDLVTDATLGTALIGYGKIMDGRAGNTNTVQVTASSAMKVDGSWYTQNVAGNVTVNQGSAPWLTNASIVGTPGVNASIQGTVPISGNVGLVGNTTLTAFQGGSPWLSNASIIGTPSVNVAQLGGATLVSGGVAGTMAVGGNQAAGVTLGMGLNPAIVAGEDYAANPKIQIPKVDSSGTQYANVSLQGTPAVTANVSIQGTVPVSGFPTAVNVSLLAPAMVTLAGNVSIGAITVNSNSSITAFQGGAPWTANVSIQGTVPVSGFPAGLNVSLANNATVTAFQGAAPWLVNASIQGTVPVSGFPAAFNVSLLAPATVTLAGNVSIGTISVSTNSSITAFQGGAPWLVNASIQGNVPVTASIAGIVTVAGNFSAQLAAGSTVAAQQLGAPWLVNASIIGTVPVSGNVGLVGNTTLTAFQGGAPWAANVSQLGQWAVTASLANNATLTAFQGGPWNVGASTVWAQQANASVQWTSATASGASLGLNTSGYGTLLVSFTGVSMTAGTVNFEAYDGAMWWPLPMLRTNSYTLDTSFPMTPQTGTNQAWQGDIAGWQQVRLRLNPAITGSQGNAYFQMIANAADNIVNMMAGATILGPVTLAGNVSIGSPTVNLAASTSLTAFQGGSPWAANVSQLGQWAVTASLANNATVTAFQGASPWLVNASIIGAHNISIAGNVTLGPVTATLAGPVNLSPLTGGWTPYATAGLASLVTLSATAGKFGGYMMMNTSANPVYLQLFDASGAVSLGLNFNMLIPFPANPTATNGLAANLEITNGSILNNGLKAAVTTGVNASIVSTGLAGTLWYH